MALAVVVIVLAACTPALADEPYVAPAPAPAPAPAQYAAPPAEATWRPTSRHEEESSWYGWQTLMADGTSLIVLPIIAGTAESTEIGVLAIGGYFLAPPIIHAAHGRWGISTASLGLRVGMVVAGGAIGSAADECTGGEWCIPVGAAFGVALGALGAVALDASLLSYEEVDSDTYDSVSRNKRPAIAWSPSVAPRKEGGFTLGLGATF